MKPSESIESVESVEPPAVATVIEESSLEESIVEAPASEEVPDIEPAVR